MGFGTLFELGVSYGDVFSYNGKEYVVVDSPYGRRVNYIVSDADLKLYKFHKTLLAQRNEVKRDIDWATKASNVKNFGTADATAPKFKMGDPVVFNDKTRKFSGKRGFVSGINTKTISVVIPLFGVVNASPGLIDTDSSYSA